MGRRPREMRQIEGIEKYRCSGCNTWKAHSEYHKAKAASAGIQSWCKKCNTNGVRSEHKAKHEFNAH